MFAYKLCSSGLKWMHLIGMGWVCALMLGIFDSLMWCDVALLSVVDSAANAADKLCSSAAAVQVS
jgi:hypothetical protein